MNPSQKAYYDFKTISTVGSMLNFTTGSHLIEKSPDNQEPTGLLEVIKLNEITNRNGRIDGVY